jgi:hypothetical protein
MTSQPQPPAAQRLLAHWIVFAVSCNVAGWVLSALHLLNAPGFLIAIPAIHFGTAKLCGLASPLGWKPHPRRWRKLLPAGFLLIAILALLGGLLYPPNNMDALHSRMPRVAHWLMAEQWEWFPANNNSQNTRSSGFEWMTAPLISLSGTDRYIFFVNFITFLFLPGACFAVFRGMGVGRRVSWAWMWLVPFGYCFALQAGSVGNDLTPAVFAVAAFAFGFRWKKDGGFTSFAIALAAAGTMTAFKPSTLPLLLPFSVMFFGMWRVALANPVRSAALAIVLALGSFLPTAAINIHKCGDWTGLQAENPDFAKVEPLVGITGNIINTSLQNLAPPVFPMAGSWNAFFIGLFPEGFKAAMIRSFEPTGAEFILPDIQGEEWAGMGAGLTYLLIVTAVITLFRKRQRSQPITKGLWLYTGLFGIALLAYFSRTGLFTVARHIAPYYPFMIALVLLAVRPENTIRTKLWKWAAAAAMLSTIAMMIITPSRPLWPAQWFFARFGEKPDSEIIRRASLGYAIYANRADALGELKRLLPTDADHIGFMSFAAGSEMPFWKPYGKKTVHHVRPGDSLEELRKSGVRHIVVNTNNFEFIMGTTPEEWANAQGTDIVARIPFQITVQAPPSDWLIVELPDSGE